MLIPPLMNRYCPTMDSNLINTTVLLIPVGPDGVVPMDVVASVVASVDAVVVAAVDAAVVAALDAADVTADAEADVVSDVISSVGHSIEKQFVFQQMIIRQVLNY